MAEAVPVDRLSVHPFGRRGVPSNLQIFPKFAVADGPPLRQKSLDLLQDQGVSLDRRGMMGLLIPDSPPDPGGLLRARQTAQALPQFGHIGASPETAPPC